MNTIGIIGYFGAGNLGDELLLKSTIGLISSLGQTKLIVFSENPPETKIFFPNCKVINKFSFFPLISSLFECDALLVGGGSIFQDASSFKSLVYYTGVCLLACLMGKKLVLLGQGVGPLNGTISKFLCKLVYQLAHSISVRDLDSYEFAKNWNANVKFSGDLVWTLKNIEFPANDTIERVIPKSVVLSLRSDKVSREQIEYFQHFLTQKFHGYKINLVALQKPDIEALEELADGLKGAEVFEIYNYGAWKQYGAKLFQDAELCLAMRFHALLLGIKAGTPCIGISYDPKVRVLCQEVNLPFIELSELNASALDECFNDAKFPPFVQLITFSERKAEMTKEVNVGILQNLFDELGE